MVPVLPERTIQMSAAKHFRRMARPPIIAAGDKSAVAETVKSPAIATGVAAVLRPNKQSLILGLLYRDGGASLAVIAEATGWLPHTTRAALTGLRKKGHAIVRGKVDGVTHYAIAAGVVA